MRLNPQQKSIAQNYFEVNKKGTCPKCARPLEAHGIISPIEFTPGGGVEVGGDTIPLLLMVCAGCGYVESWAAIKVGVVLPDGSVPMPAQPPEVGEPQ